MRKKLLPALLSFVLLFSLVTTAFAKPMTVVLEATGDTNKEFVFYIQTSSVYIDPAQDHVEKIDALWKKCNCGFVVLGSQQNATEIWEDHIFKCGRNFLNATYTYHKITLKNGEKIAINTIAPKPTIYMEQEAGYPISYSTDGVNFTQYANDPKITVYPETGMATFNFDSVENGTLIIRRTEPVAGTTPSQPVQPTPSVTAKPTNDALWVDGTIRNATVYKIDGSNYFKIRDLAAVLNGTSKQFSVGYDAASKSVTATTGNAYEAVGGELSGPAPSSQTATVSRDTILVNGAVAQNVTVYKIAGNNYFKLRDLGNALGFDVDYESGKGMIINTGTTAACNHNWATRHVDEVGHMESTGTHIVRHYICACGNFDAWGDDPNYQAKRNEHYDPFNNGCTKHDIVWEVEKPNDPTYIVDAPVHDETYCTICGATK